MTVVVSRDSDVCECASNLLRLAVTQRANIKHSFVSCEWQQAVKNIRRSPCHRDIAQPAEAMPDSHCTWAGIVRLSNVTTTCTTFLMHVWLQFKSPHKACLQQPKISFCVENSVCTVLTLIIMITGNQHCEYKKIQRSCCHLQPLYSYRLFWSQRFWMIIKRSSLQ